jgi:hypothetical protein
LTVKTHPCPDSTDHLAVPFDKLVIVDRKYGQIQTVGVGL